MIARFSHPNIVMAYDADEDAAGPFLVMEYVNGQDLASLVQKRGPLGVSAAVNCILQAARGLEYAHNQGIIHRDIKPANLLRDVTGIVKVTDLGLARFTSAASAAETAAAGGITQAGGVMGTVDYMSPEQAVDSTTIDQRADIYSLGGTLYFLLVGQPPYQGQNMMATLLQHRDAPIPSLAEARKEVPLALDSVFRRMLAKTAGARYQTMTEVVTALESVEASLGDKVAEPPAGMVLPMDESATGLSIGVWEGQTISAAPPGAPPQTIDLRRPDTPQGLPLKVLLVEPSRTQSVIIRKYLQAQGVQHTFAVASGQEALKVVRSEPLDAILSALHLPDMTGVELAQRLRAESKAAEPGFVLISSEAESSEAGTLSKCGNAVHLRKPFTPEQLVEALRLVSDHNTPCLSTAKGKLRVLIVDDSAAARVHLRGVLTGLGLAQFVEAADGAQAVAAVARQAFDLIVTDYNMPFMDGRGLVGYLKQNPATASVPIIMVTTETEPAKLEAVRGLGVAAVCDKSFPPEIVRKVIDDLNKHVDEGV
jgi:CheY-like chemotaxis protein